MNYFLATGLFDYDGGVLEFLAILVLAIHLAMKRKGTEQAEFQQRQEQKMEQVSDTLERIAKTEREHGTEDK